MLAPDGKIIVDAQGALPPAASGVGTQGPGDIRLFSKGSMPLGLSLQRERSPARKALSVFIVRVTGLGTSFWSLRTTRPAR